MNSSCHVSIIFIIKISKLAQIMNHSNFKLGQPQRKQSLNYQIFNKLGYMDLNRTLKGNKGESSEMHPQHSQLDRR